MFSYYLQDRSYYFANTKEVEEHLKQLNSILTNADEYDHFLKSKVFLNRPFDKNRTIMEFFYGGDICQSIKRRILPFILRRFKDIDHAYMGLSEMDSVYTSTVNAFLGARFTTPSRRLLTLKKEYETFRSYYARVNVTGRNFEKCCKVLLKRIIIGEIAIDNVRSYGKEVGQILEDLIALDKYICEFWINGSFDERDAQAKTSIVISDESNTTKSNPRYKNKRHFSIPGIGGRDCFLHIKSGDGKRFHIYPDERTKIIYVPYIGPHLPTRSNP
jgi:hypothetical protein